ncbi:NF-kappa-B-repressing factor [Spea bombifrons]|uniref:NF-kappa-B-repressing factor n=1 Tax=Spea bombifrons TaxID=233779 RepID=UPI00234A8D30|nr:NF-kappa-B-repressing factor [Spea bombifrons]
MDGNTRDPVQGDGDMDRVRVEDFRQYHESDKQWAARKQFLQKHLHLYPGRKVEQLIALSVVWTNIVFMGNRYGELLTQKVHQMAEEIDIGEMPSFELVPGAKATKRPGGADNAEQPQKKFASRLGPRPRFQPVHFVVGTDDDSKLEPTKKTQGADLQTADAPSMRSFDSAQIEDSVVQNSCVFTADDVCVTEEDNEMEPEPHPFIYDASKTMEDQSKSEPGNFMSRMTQNYSAKYESHYSETSKDFHSNVFNSYKDKQARKGFGFVGLPHQPDKYKQNREAGRHNLQTQDKTAFIKQLSDIVRQNTANPTLSFDDKQVNYTFLLTRSIQACKKNPEYIYAPLREINPSCLPENHTLPKDGYACEVRCQDIYLATGYSGSKNGARDRAAKNAIELLKRPVEVVEVTRRYGHTYQGDFVVWLINRPLKDFPPVLKQQNVDNFSQSGSQIHDFTKAGLPSKSWTDFILTENACDAIGILNNSATFNRMNVEYRYEMTPSKTWRCSVYVQDHYIAHGYGNKKSSKHAAAEKAVSILKSQQPNLQKSSCSQPQTSAHFTELKDVMIYEKASNPVCTLNDTAQFNKVTVDYIFEKIEGFNWKCKVFMEGQFLAEAIGLRKTVKHTAAEEAVKVLKKTQPVVINNVKNSSVQDAISRHQIQGWSKTEANRQQIKEDNIGNQLLRKMGWTGGGLGKSGEGIAEPISVTEQFHREGLGLVSTKHKINKSDLEQIIRVYASSHNQDDLTFSRGLSNEERKLIHQLALRYGLKSKSHGQGEGRFLVVSRKRNKQELIHQLRCEGQVGSYALVMPQEN